MLSKRRKDRNAESIGNIIKEARNNAGYTQKALADALGLEYYTMISQIELGYVSIPPALWLPLTNTLRLNSADFITRCVFEYQPELAAALFMNKSRAEAAWLLDCFTKGKLDDYLKTVRVVVNPEAKAGDPPD